MSILTLLATNVDRDILESAGEIKMVEVHKHWCDTFFPWVRVVIGVLIGFGALTLNKYLAWIIGVLALVLIFQALWRILDEYRDCFVVTNQRVFRKRGVLRTSRASVPLLRILDITSNKPLLGRWFNYGHFVFKSAAEVAGLSEIRFVPNIDEVENVLRMTMQGDLPIEPVPAGYDDGT